MTATVPRPRDLRTLDLNLLVTLDVLLAEQNVTRAAKRLGATQSTISHSLSRLREELGDPLLVRDGRGMVRTPRAESLAPALARALASVREALESGAFTPDQTTRRFVVAAPDLIALFAPMLVQSVFDRAPHATIEFRSLLGFDLSRALADGAVDLALVPAISLPSNLIQKKLGALHHAVLARRDHPALSSRHKKRPRSGQKRALSLDDWLAYPHIQARTDTGAGHMDRALLREGKKRHVGVIVESFLFAPYVVASTNCFFSTPRELVIDIADKLDLVLLEPPIAVPPLAISALWHERTDKDPAHAWFRDIAISMIRGALARRAPQSSPSSQR